MLRRLNNLGLFLQVRKINVSDTLFFPIIFFFFTIALRLVLSSFAFWQLISICDRKSTSFLVRLSSVLPLKSATSLCHLFSKSDHYQKIRCGSFHLSRISWVCNARTGAPFCTFLIHTAFLLFDIFFVEKQKLYVVFSNDYTILIMITPVTKWLREFFHNAFIVNQTSSYLRILDIALLRFIK